MSKTVDPSGDPAEKDEDWLERNARALDLDRWRDTDAWERATDEADGAEYHETGPTTFDVEFPDGDQHVCLLVRRDDDPDPDDYAGACDCDGFQYHGRCSHLCALARTDVLKDIVETLPSVYDRLVDNDVEHRDEVLEDDVDQEGDPDVVDVDATVEPQGSDPENRPVAPSKEGKSPVTPSDPFAEQLAEDVPERFVMELKGETYVRRAGFAAIARQAGLRPRVKAITPAEETDFQHARYEGVIRDQDGQVVASDVGTSHVDHEDMTGAEGELDELAATRAIRRALEWATGAGASLQEGP